MSFFTAYITSLMSIKWFTARSNVLKVCKALEVLKTYTVLSLGIFQWDERTKRVPFTAETFGSHLKRHKSFTSRSAEVTEKTRTCVSNLSPKLVHDFIAIFQLPNYLGSQWRNRLIPQLRATLGHTWASRILYFALRRSNYARFSG